MNFYSSNILKLSFYIRNRQSILCFLLETWDCYRKAILFQLRNFSRQFVVHIRLVQFVGEAGAVKGIDVDELNSMDELPEIIQPDEDLDADEDIADLEKETRGI